jgi:carbonic anhydrase/acetyltransferase-like protein (isoleucine patch superfamily)
MLQRFAGLVPRIHPGAWVHESAVVIGDVELEEGVSVWPTAVLRGDMGPIRIGRDSNLQDGAICHDTTDRSETTIGARVTVGHRAILHGCKVGDDCLVGMGSIVMDNAVVGEGSFVGAGTLIPPGKIIPPRSLVLGSPGRVIRPVTEDETRQIAFAWNNYREKLAVWLGR